MKKSLVLLLSCGFLSVSSFAQSPCKLIYKEGDKIGTLTYSYVNSFEWSDKFMKMKPQKKQEVINKFNEEALSGKIKVPKYPFYTDVSAVYNSSNGEYQVTEIEYKMNGNTTSNNYIVMNDTLFLQKFEDGIIFLANGGDTTGISIYGVEKIPCHLSETTTLPTYLDYTITIPQEYRTKGMIKVFAGYEKVSGMAFGSGIDSKTGEAFNGLYSYEKSIPQYINKEVDALATVKTQNITINNVISKVTGTEEFKINGKTYTATIVECENWTKMNADFSFYSAYQEAVDNANKGLDNISKFIERKMQKQGITNEHGYVVSYTTKYIVPELGIVKSLNYGAMGVLISNNELINVTKN